MVAGLLGGLGGAGGGVIGRAVLEVFSDTSKAEGGLTRLQRGLAIGTVTAFAAATIGATKFETQMTKIETLVGINTATLRVWQGELLGISAAAGKGPGELAQALFVVTSAGERGAAALEVVESAAKASAIGLGNTAAIARTVTSAMQAWGPEVLSAARATDILTAIVREGNLEASSLAGSLGRVLGIAAQVGVSFEDVGAFIAVFTRLGVSAEEAVTALRSILVLLINPTKQSAEALAEAGLSMAALRRVAVEEGLPQALNKLVQAFAGNEEALAQVIPNVRALSGVLGTAGAQGEQFATVLRNIQESTGIVDEGFARVSETTEFQFNRALAALQVSLISIGSVFLPQVAQALGVLANATGAAASAFAALPEPVQQLVLGLIALKTLGPVVVLGLVRIKAALIALHAVAMAHPWLLVATAITVGVVVAYGLLKKSADEVNESLRTQLDLLRAIRDLPLEEALANLAEAERDLVRAESQRAFLQRELNQATRAANEPVRAYQARLLGLRRDVDAASDAEKDAGAIRDEARAQLDRLTQGLALNVAAQTRHVSAVERGIEALKDERGALEEKRAAILDNADPLGRGIQLTEDQQRAVGELDAEIGGLTIRIGGASDGLEMLAIDLELAGRAESELADATRDAAGAALEHAAALEVERRAAQVADFVADILSAQRIAEKLGIPLQGVLLLPAQAAEIVALMEQLNALRRAEVSGSADVTASLEEQIGALLRTGAASGPAAAGLDKVAQALQGLEERQTADAAKAFIDALLTGADPARALERVRSAQEKLDRQWEVISAGLRSFGFETVEIFRDIFEESARELEEGGRRIGGLLGVLWMRRAGMGLDPGAGLFEAGGPPGAERQSATGPLVWVENQFIGEGAEAVVSEVNQRVGEGVRSALRGNP